VMAQHFRLLDTPARKQVFRAREFMKWISGDHTHVYWWYTIFDQEEVRFEMKDTLSQSELMFLTDQGVDIFDALVLITEWELSTGSDASVDKSWKDTQWWLDRGWPETRWPLAPDAYNNEE